MIVLDTHAWVWWVSDPDRLPKSARKRIKAEVNSGDPLRVSSISAWEVAMLVERGRMELTIDVRDWIAKSHAIPLLEFVPVDNMIAVRSVQLPDFPHRDPADRMIVATALGLGATLVTADQRLAQYEHVETIWD